MQIDINTVNILTPDDTQQQYQFGYDGARLVELQRNKNQKYSLSPNNISINNNIIVSDQTQLLNDLQLYNSIKNLDTTKVLDIRLNLVQGVPRCGKTTFILKHYKPGDLILFPTRGSALDFRKRYMDTHHNSNKNTTKDTFRTLHSFLINSTRHIQQGNQYNRLIIDEALMIHAGEILFAAALSGAKEVLLIGDTNQIPYINRTTAFEVKFHKISEIATIIKVLTTSYRCTRTTTALLSKYYPQGMKTTNNTENELKVLNFEGLENLNLPTDEFMVLMARYVKKELEKDIKLISTSTNESELVCETALFEIKLKKQILQILGVYRPPSAKLEDAIDIMTEQLNTALHSHKQIVLLGDINIENLVISNNNTTLENFLTSYDIVRLPLPPTRITPESATSIDWICSNINPKLIKTSVILSGLSDHSAQIATINIPKSHPEEFNEKKRLINNRTMDLFKNRLQLQNWSTVLTTVNGTEAYGNFNRIIQPIQDETCPLKLIKRKQLKAKHFWDEECTRLKRAYITALEKELRTGKAEDKATTVLGKKEYDQRLKSLRREHTIAHITRAENKSKALWQVINNEKQKKSTNNTGRNDKQSSRYSKLL